MARISSAIAFAVVMACMAAAHAEPRVANLNLQRGFGTPLAPTPSVFASSVASPYTEIGPESPAPLARYIAATLAYERGTEPGQPVNESDLEHDEGAFLHTADPAALTVVRRTTSGLELYWAKDGRDGALAPLSYSVYRNTGAGMQAVATVAVDATARYQRFADPAALAAGQAVCYEVRSVDQGGQERNYSMVQCAPTAQAAFVKHLRVAVVEKVCPAQIELSAKCGDPVRAKTECFCDVSYSIEAEVEGDVRSAQLQWWGYTPGPLTDRPNQCGDTFHENVNQCLQPFRLLSSQLLARNGTSFAGTATRREPIIRNYWGRGDKRTESPLVRLNAVAADGSALAFPRAGYLSQLRNNRLRDRMFTGINTNPASGTWARGVVSAALALRPSGFDGVFLDEFRPLKADVQVLNGSNHEGPAIEYPYAPGATQDPAFVDPWTTGLAALTANLRYWDDALRPPGSAPTRWFGNAVQVHLLAEPIYTIRAREELRGSAGLDEVMLETCFAGVELATDATWEGTVRRLDEVTARGQRVNCHIAPSGAENVLLTAKSPLAPGVRMYALASFLMANDQALATLGAWEINPTVVPPSFPAKLINDFVEYHTDLGAPLAPRRQVGARQCWLREYANGVVVVNANSAGDCDFALPRQAHPLRLVRPLTRPDHPYDPGDAALDAATATVALPPVTGLIALNSGVPAPAYPRRYYANARYADFNRDRYTDLYLYNPGNGQSQLRYGRRHDGLRFVQNELRHPQQQLVPGNFNGDAYTDLFAYNADGRTTLHYAFPDALGEIANGQWNSGFALIPGDYDGNGYEDLFLYGNTGQVEVRYGGAGLEPLRFSQASHSTWNTGHTLVPGDYDGDGRTDLLVYASDGRVEIRYGQAGAGLRFAPASQAQWNLGHRLVPGDFNGDGCTDVFIYGADGQVEIRYGHGGGDGLRFAPASQARWNSGHRFVPGDFNSDGYADLFVYAADGATEIRYGRRADGLDFAAASQQRWTTGLRLVSGDFNGDYFSDLAVYDPVTGDGEIRYGRAAPGLRVASVAAEPWGPGLQLISGTWKQY